MKLTKFFMTFLNDDMAVITYRSVLYVCACLLQSKVFQSSSHREITRKKNIIYHLRTNHTLMTGREFCQMIIALAILILKWYLIPPLIDAKDRACSIKRKRLYDEIKTLLKAASFFHIIMF